MCKTIKNRSFQKKDETIYMNIIYQKFNQLSGPIPRKGQDL